MAYDILIVDDSAVTRALIKRTIKMTDLPVGTLHEAGDGKAGLAFLATGHVDLVLADLHMPIMDGAEMTRNILSNAATTAIPVIVISAEPNEAQIAGLKQLGIKGYLRKPFTPEALREVHNTILGVAHA